MITQLGMYHSYCHHTYAQVTETAHIDAEAEKLLFADPQAVGNYALCTYSIFYHYYFFYHHCYYYYYYHQYYWYHHNLTHQVSTN